MSKPTVADQMWDMLAEAGVKRVYGIVGDALNPTMDALSRHKNIEFVHVRNEEWGAFAASADARISEGPVAVCGTAGPGVTHLLNGLLDAKHERSKVIAVAGDVETELIDTEAIEEISPYDLFRTASLYTGRVVNRKQAPQVFAQAINTCVAESGPTVIALPGDIASQDAEDIPTYTPVHHDRGCINDKALDTLVELIEEAKHITILGGDGCRHSADDVIALAQKLDAPVGYSYKGKQWLEPDNPNAVGMSGLLGYGGCWDAMHNADLLIMLGTDYPFPTFLPDPGKTKIVQIDINPTHIGRRVPVVLGAHGDVGETARALLKRVTQRDDEKFVSEHVETTKKWHEKLHSLVENPNKDKAIRPELVAHLVSELADDDAMFFMDTGTPCIWNSRHMIAKKGQVMMGSFSWASMANASPNSFGAKKAAPHRQSIAFCGDGGFSMLGLGDIITEVQHKTNNVHIIFNNTLLDFVNIEQQEAGLVPFGTDLPNPNYAAVATALGATGERVEKVEDLRPALERALNHTGGPVVLDIVVDKYALAKPSHIPLETLEGFTLSAMKQSTHGHLGDILEEALHNWKLL